MKSIIKLFLVAMAVVAMTGCSTTNHKSVEDFMGKVWRAEVTGGLEDPFAQHKLPEEDAKAWNYTYEASKGIRAVRISFRTEGSIFTQKIAVAVVPVPDSVQTDDVRKGAIVDVIMETGPDVNYQKFRVNRIIRLVCRSGDGECRSRIKKDGTLNTIVDRNPGDGSQYGMTYAKRITPEEYDEYKKR